MSIKRSLFFAAAIAAPLALGGCVVEPGTYYSDPGYYNGSAYYTGPAVYGPTVYVGHDRGYHRGWSRGGDHGGWHGRYHR